MKSEQKKVYLEILHLFKSKEPEDYRIWTYLVLQKDNYNWSTDGCALIRTPIVYDKAMIKSWSKANLEFNQEFSITITLKELKQKASQLEYEDKFEDDEIECDDCGSYGQVEWSYDNYTKDDDCPVCKGSGYIKNPNPKKTGLKILKENQRFKIQSLEIVIRPAYMIRLIKVCELLNSDKIILYRSYKGQNYFKIKDVDVILMSMMFTDEKDNEIIELETY
jgi:hypothetical protein